MEYSTNKGCRREHKSSKSITGQPLVVEAIYCKSIYIRSRHSHDRFASTEDGAKRNFHVLFGTSGYPHKIAKAMGALALE